jgi:Fe2+ transport system protein B
MVENEICTDPTGDGALWQEFRQLYEQQERRRRLWEEKKRAMEERFREEVQQQQELEKQESMEEEEDELSIHSFNGDFDTSYQDAFKLKEM